MNKSFSPLAASSQLTYRPLTNSSPIREMREAPDRTAQGIDPGTRVHQSNPR